MDQNFARSSAISRIEANYHNMTATEQVIARFFLDGVNSQNLAASGIAAKLSVSEPSLSRFAKKCGYTGYREFVFDYQQDQVRKPENITKASLQVLESYQDLLSRTYSLMDENQAKRIVEWIANSGRVFICGLGSSGIAAKECAMRFMRIGVDITCLDERDMMAMQSVFSSESHVVIGCSISGTTRAVCDYLKRAHEKKAKTIFITASNREIFSGYCDEVVLIPSLEHLNYGNSISPQFPLLVMMDLMFACALNMDLESRMQLHVSTVQALD